MFIILIFFFLYISTYIYNIDIKVLQKLQISNITKVQTKIIIGKRMWIISEIIKNKEI